MKLLKFLFGCLQEVFEKDLKMANITYPDVEDTWISPRVHFFTVT